MAAHEGFPGSTAQRNALPDLNRAAIFLDFDGALVEIASRPDGVGLRPETGELPAGPQTTAEWRGSDVAAVPSILRRWLDEGIA